MDYYTLKLSLYERCESGDISTAVCESMICNIDNKCGEDIVSEMRHAETEFIDSTMNIMESAATIDTDIVVEAAKTFGDKVRALWEKFKKWVKGIIDKITGRSKKAKKGKIKVPKGLMKALDQLKNGLNKLKGAKGAAAIAAALAAVVSAVAIVKKLKPSKKVEGPTEEVEPAKIVEISGEIAQASSAVADSDAAKPIAEESSNHTPKTYEDLARRDSKTVLQDNKTVEKKTDENKPSPSAVVSAVQAAASAVDAVSNAVVLMLPMRTEAGDAEDRKLSQEASNALSEFLDGLGYNEVWHSVDDALNDCHAYLKYMYNKDPNKKPRRTYNDYLKQYGKSQSDDALEQYAYDETRKIILTYYKTPSSQGSSDPSFDKYADDLKKKTGPICALGKEIINKGKQCVDIANKYKDFKDHDVEFDLNGVKAVVNCVDNLQKARYYLDGYYAGAQGKTYRYRNWS